MSPRRGFTLLESLGALAILALAVPTVVLSLSDAAARSKRVENRRVQHQMAERLLSLALVQVNGEPGRTAGREAGYAWEVETEPLAEMTGSPKDRIPFRVRVSVSDPQSGRPYVLETLFFARRS